MGAMGGGAGGMGVGRAPRVRPSGERRNRRAGDDGVATVGPPPCVRAK